MTGFANCRPMMAVLFSLALTGCGSTVSYTDKPAGLYIGGAAPVADQADIKLSDSPPPEGGQEVVGASCKNKIWEASPTNAAAVAVLKRETKEAGYNTVYVSSIEKDPNAVFKNCWSAIIAKGVAFNS